MLDELEIRGLGVIDRATLRLGPGFTAITGETGAGKTMLVTALGLLLGGRANAQVVRAGAERARVEGRATVPVPSALATLVDDAGGELDPVDHEHSELLLTRQVLASGRSRAWIGGQGVPAKRLGEAGELLVAVHGQSEQLRLAQEPTQRAALDALAGESGIRVRETLARHWDALGRLRDELTTLRGDADARAAEREQLRELVDQVDAIDPQPDEDTQLLARIERLANREELRALIGEAHGMLAGESGGSYGAGAAAPLSLRDLAQQVRSRIDRALRSDGSLDTTVESAADLEYAIDDLSARLASYLADLDTDGLGELDPLNDRLQALEDLKRAQHGTLAEVLDRAAAAGERLLALSGDDQRIPALETEIAELETALETAADELTALRRAAADTLAAQVTAELHALAMPNARSAVELTSDARIHRHGRDRVAFVLQPHPGSAAVPLGQGASGGELSRIMLAVEVVLAAANPVPTLVFDEIDAGVGGAAALEIGARLQRLARTHQVVVVTHLAQVAAFADHHVRIEKSTDGEVTSSLVTELDADARVAEMTRLLSGLTESASGREHAEELLARAARDTAAEPGARASVR